MAIHSDWGDWLPQAVAAAEPAGVAIWYLGCNGFVLKASDGTTIFIDPYLGAGDPPRTVRMIPVPFAPEDIEAADAIFATHEHTDHVHGPTQAPILAGTDAQYVAPNASIEKVEAEGWLDDWSVAPAQFSTIRVGDELQVGSFTVHVEPAYDPDAEEPVSYVITHDAGTVFHGGDTKPDSLLADIGDQYDIDLGILAFGSVGMLPDKNTREPKRTKWYADENEVIDAASSLRLDRLLPSHWDMWRGLTADPSVLVHHARSFAHPRHVELVAIGDCIDL